MSGLVINYMWQLEVSGTVKDVRSLKIKLLHIHLYFIATQYL